MKLLKKTSIPIQTCYDLSVRKNHNFFANGVCVHNSNAGFRVEPDNSYTFQSRERELTLESDNAGFAMWGERNISDLMQTIQNVRITTGTKSRIVIYSEWCGGSIQKGVALNQLPKMFVVFNITLIDDQGNRTELTPEQISSAVYRTEEIRCIYDYQTWKISIDFNDPAAVQNQLVEWTMEVENECPVGKAHGVTEGCKTGEGIVYWCHERNLKFKVKGSAHSPSRVKTLKEIAAVDIEKMNSIKELVASAVSENRLKQGLDKLGEMGLEIDIKNTKQFMSWISADVMREERDTIIASGFDVKEIMPHVSEAAKKFWFETLNKQD